MTVILLFLEKDKNFLLSIVRSVFDTDGSFHCKKGYGRYDTDFRKIFHCYPKIELTSISESLLKQLQKILKDAEIDSSIRLGNKGGIINNRLCKPSYRLTVYKIRDIVAFFNIIKPKNSRHVTRYKVWKKFGFLPPRTNLNERKKILKNEINPYIYYAGVPERSNGLDSLILSKKAKLKT